MTGRDCHDHVRRLIERHRLRDMLGSKFGLDEARTIELANRIVEVLMNEVLGCAQPSPLDELKLGLGIPTLWTGGHIAVGAVIFLGIMSACRSTRVMAMPPFELPHASGTLSAQIAVIRVVVKREAGSLLHPT